MRVTRLPLLTLALVSAAVASLQRVGDVSPSGIVVPTGQFVKTAGTRWMIPGRPVDIVAGPHAELFVKTISQVLQLDTNTGAVIHSATIGSASLHGLAVSPDGADVYATDALDGMHVLNVADGLKESKLIHFPAAKVGGSPYPCGVAISADGKTAYVCLSRSNLLAIVDLKTSSLAKSVQVSPSPYDVALFQGKALVACWGRSPGPTSPSALSSGTPVSVDNRGIATGGSFDIIDLKTEAIKTIETGGQPSQIAVTSDGVAHIPCANSDTIETIDLLSEWPTRRQAENYWWWKGGVAPNAIAADERFLYITCGGINAICLGQYDRLGPRVVNGIRIIQIRTGSPPMALPLPTDWYPIGVAKIGNALYVANAKGIGSRSKPTSDPKKAAYDFTGTVSKIDVSDFKALMPVIDKQLHELDVTPEAMSHIPDIGFSTPKHPSPIKHVFYVIKENRTYDQVFGDIAKGDGDPNLVVFGRFITPNMHALAERFGLLDNFYCTGVISSDGHAWAVEGNATSYFERSFGGWTRSYPFGDDPISPSSTGFIWNDAQNHGKSFRNYGEFDYAASTKKFSENLKDLQAGKKTQFGQNINTKPLIPYSQRDFPGWNMEIPDQVRAHRFVDDFNLRVANGTVPDLSLIYLPEDHTGASVSAATCVADNDRGLGLVVQAISHSSVWKNSAIFVVEDDSQAGFDHVDGHRSPCLVISPYCKPRAVIKDFYNQGSVLHTIEGILGIPPMNRMDANAPVMSTCFQSTPNLDPFDALPLGGKLAKASELEIQAHFDVSKPDQVDEDKANRLVWKLMRPGERYPAEYAGPHGQGLKTRGLRLEDVAKHDD